MGMDELVLMKYGEAYREVIIEEMREEVREEVIGKVREEVISEVRDIFIERGEKNTLRRNVFRLFKKGFSVEQIVDLLDIPQSQVEDLFLLFKKEEQEHTATE